MPRPEPATKRPLIIDPDMTRTDSDIYTSLPRHTDDRHCQCDTCCEGVCDCNHDTFLCCCCLWWFLDKQDTVF